MQDKAWLSGFLAADRWDQDKTLALEIFRRDEGRASPSALSHLVPLDARVGRPDSRRSEKQHLGSGEPSTRTTSPVTQKNQEAREPLRKEDAFQHASHPPRKYRLSELASAGSCAGQSRET